MQTKHYPTSEKIVTDADWAPAAPAEPELFQPGDTLHLAAKAWAESIAAWFGVSVSVNLEAPGYRYTVDCDGRGFTPTMQRAPEDR